jgi:ABC-2 type transport system ATP-binding protein
MEIVVENLIKHFGPRKAVDSISFNVRKGEVVGLLGSDGAGKTTTMKMLAGILHPDRGSITLDNRALHEHPVRLKHHIGYVAEHAPVYEKMNVVDFLRFIGNLYRIPRNKAMAKILNVIRSCGLENEKHKNIGELSKGCRQRLGIAQALVHDPNVLLLDEPTAGLDPKQITEIRNIINTVGQERTVILASRILAGIETTCDRVMIMNHGKIVASKTISELHASSCMDPRLRVSIKGGELAHVKEALSNLAGISQVVEIDDRYLELRCAPECDIESSIFNMCQDRHWYIAELTPVPIRLEDLLSHVTPRV